MKYITLLILGVMAMAEEPNGPSFEDKITAIKNNSLLNVRMAIESSTSAVVYRLSANTDEKHGFPIKPYGISSYSKIIEERKLSGSDFDPLKKALTEIGNDSIGNVGLCHEPGFGLRFYYAKDVIYETSICFKCNNFYVPVVDTSQWYPIGTEDYRRNLKIILKSLMDNDSLPNK